MLTKFNSSCLWALFAYYILPSAVQGQDLAVSHIPQELMEKADVIKRFEDIRFEINSTVNTLLKHRYALTILNENGAEHANIELYFSKLSAIKAVSGVLYDANGKEIRKIRGKEFKESSAVGNSNLMDDNRVLSYNLLHRTYPYTIVYEYEEQHNNSLFFENWYPVNGDRFAVEESKFSIVYPAGQQIRYKTYNYSSDPEKSTVKNKEVLSWEIKNFKPIELQVMSPVFYELVPAVFTGPEDFEIEGYKGNMSSWQTFGKFVAALTSGRDQLPAKVKDDVRKLTAGLTSDWDKTNVLYNYLQRNTRYISIQLGLGGWQPYDAAYVAANAYGDCKALTNYMYSLLKEAGITSYYTLVRAGNKARPVIADMPSQQFNHVILAVTPQNADTIWLECTSQTLPTGYLSSFTANRNALLIDAAGGKLVHTPRYGLTENLQTRHIDATLQDNGQLNMHVHTVYTGQQQDPVHGLINNLSAEKVKKELNESFDLATYDIVAFKHLQKGGVVPQIDETLQINVQNYATITGKRLFIQPNILTKTYRRLPDEERKFDIEVSFPYLDIDTVQIKIPTGYEVESMPDDITLDGKFGNFSTQYTVMDDIILCYRRMEHLSGTYPAADYTALRQFYEAIYKADRNRIVLVKNTE